MGQYFIVANTTRQEFLHPHKFGEGLKFLEFTTGDFGVMHGLAHLLAQSSDGVAIDDPEITGRWIGDNVVIVGDYETNGEYLIVAKEPSTITLNSKNNTKVKIKSLADIKIVPDNGLIDGKWETINLDGDSSVELVFVDELDCWVIVSSDGLKDS